MSREEANQIIKMKEERKAARLAAAAKSSTPVAVGPSVKSASVYNKDDDVHSSGNNSGNDSHEEANEEKRSPARRPSTVNFDSNTTSGGSANASQGHIGSSSVELPGFRELLSTRVRVDNGFVSGKGQGKAL